MVGRYAFLESVALADCAVELEAADLGDLFATAAEALADVMVDPATVTPTLTRRIGLTAESLELLLFDWLSELIYLKDREGLVFVRAEVEVERGATCALKATVWGAALDRERMALRADPKAVTLHRFEVEPRVEGGWRARLVIDI